MAKKFPVQYARAEDLPIDVSFDPRLLFQRNGDREGSGNSKLAALRQEMASLDLNLERGLVSEHQKLTKNKNKQDSVSKKTYSPPPLPASISPPTKTDEYDAKVRQIAKTIEGISLRPTDYQKDNNNTDNNQSTTPEQKATELARLYLPNETEVRQSSFVLIYLASRQMNTIPTELEVLKAFFLFDSDAEKAIGFMNASLALCELGFGEDQVTNALLTCNNNMNDALEHLMSS